MTPTAAPRVLYIDDDPGLARLVQKTLQRAGFEVEFAALRRRRTVAPGDSSTSMSSASTTTCPAQTGLDILPRIRRLAGCASGRLCHRVGGQPGRRRRAEGRARSIMSGRTCRAIFATSWPKLSSTLSSRSGCAGRRKRPIAKCARRATAPSCCYARSITASANSLAIVAALASMQRAHGYRTIRKAGPGRNAGANSRVAGVHNGSTRRRTCESVEIGAYLEGLIEELKGSMLALGRAMHIVLRCK